MNRERAFIRIHGIVQGVGFRPSVHRLVREHALSGFIKNTSSGVELELEGEHGALEAFLAELPEKMPRLAMIDGIETQFGLPPAGYQGFEIRASRQEETRNTLISPDIGICDDCLRELLTPSDRRYRYPFINCTNCGPRFTIIKDVPYDRDKTSMSSFPMCPACAAEYHDIENRRYHAQPDACPDCGPHVFYQKNGQNGFTTGEQAILEAQQALREGQIVAVKGLGGMHLACRIDDAGITQRLRRRKERDEKPFAVMCRNVDCAKKFCEVSEEEEAVLTGFRRPIVLLRKRRDAAKWLSHLSENAYLGVMLPYTPLHVLLFENEFDALVMTSANISDTPIVSDNAEALEKLKEIADGFLLHNRDIQTRCDDSLCSVFGGKEYFIRRSRGYVPFPIRCGVLPEKTCVLACGAEQKASFCLTKGKYAFPSQHIGDLKNFETLLHYQQQIAHFERLFDLTPQIMACDLHPDYLSTEFAREQSDKRGLALLPVQHHHAHMAACMADNDLTGKCIGLIWDGTGLGADGVTWGGECLVGGYEGFERFGSIRPIPLIGGDRAVRELDRVAYALLREAETGPVETEKTARYEKMLQSGLNCPLSSGMGRLFDGVSALLGIKELAGYEGQGAVLLEAAAVRGETRYYPAEFEEDRGIMRFDWRPMIVRLLLEKRNGVETGVLSARFLNTLAEMAVRQCTAARDASGLRRVVLSGGTFQNLYLMNALPEKLREAGFEVYSHRRVACNDEGISLGQAVIVGRRLDPRSGE